MVYNLPYPSLNEMNYKTVAPVLHRRLFDINLNTKNPKKSTSVSDKSRTNNQSIPVVCLPLREAATKTLMFDVRETQLFCVLFSVSCVMVAHVLESVVVFCIAVPSLGIHLDLG